MRRGFPHDSHAFRAKWGIIMGAGMVVDGVVSILSLGNVQTGLGFKAATACIKDRAEWRNW